MRGTWALIVCAPMLAAGGWLVQNDSDVQRGQDAYEAGHYERSATLFRKALGGEGDRDIVQYNLGTALAQQAQVAGHAESRRQAARLAIASLKSALDSNDEGVRLDAHYNLGNALIVARRYDEAIENYKIVLRASPSRDGARHNLELAQLLRRAEIPPPEPGGTGAGETGAGPVQGQPGSAPGELAGDGLQDGQSGQAVAAGSHGDASGSGQEAPAAGNSAAAEEPTDKGPGMRTEPRAMAEPGATDANAIQHKLDALERRSGELRRTRVLRKTRTMLRSPLTNGEEG